MNNPNPVAHFQTGLKGVVQHWEVVNPDGSIAQAGGDYQNLILDQGMDMPATTYFRDLFTHCAVGTDGTAPAQDDTGLGNEIHRTDNTSEANSSVDDTAKTVTHRRVFAFEEGDFDSGVDGTYKEVGFAPGSGESLFARTLFKDADGNPVEVSVASDQVLRVTYELVLSPQPNSETTATVDITGLGTVGYTHMVQKMAVINDYPTFAYAFVDEYPGNGANLFLEPSIGLNDQYTDFVVVPYVWNFYEFNEPTNADLRSDGFHLAGPKDPDAYTSGNYYRDVTFVLEPDDYNDEVVSFGVVGVYSTDSAQPSYMAVLDSADRFTKADTHQLTLVFRRSWARN